MNPDRIPSRGIELLHLLSAWDTGSQTRVQSTSVSSSKTETDLASLYTERVLRGYPEARSED